MLGIVLFLYLIGQYQEILTAEKTICVQAAPPSLNHRDSQILSCVNLSDITVFTRFIKEGHAEINQLKTSVAELKDGFSNLEISFKKVSFVHLITACLELSNPITLVFDSSGKAPLLLCYTLYIMLYIVHYTRVYTVHIHCTYTLPYTAVPSVCACHCGIYTTLLPRQRQTTEHDI